MKRLVSAALLLTASGALADSSVPQPDVPAREILGRTPGQTPNSDEQLRTLTRSIESLDAEIQRLREVERERAEHQPEFLDQNDHKLWP